MTDIQILHEDQIVNPNGYYVYVHRRATDKSIFYVGKGKRNRFRSAYKRSRWWLNVARKHGVICEIVKSFRNEKCAFSYEKILISIIGKENLVNVCDGGEGASGLVMPQSTKDKIGNANKGRVRTSEAIEKHRISMSGFKQSEETKMKLREIALSTIPNRPDNYGDLVSIGKRQKEAYVFKHKDGRVFVGTKFDFRAEHGLSSTRVHDIVSVKRNTAKGWFCVGVNPPG